MTQKVFARGCKRNSESESLWANDVLRTTMHGKQAHKRNVHSQRMLMRGGDLGSAALDSGIFLNWWTGVVLLAPDEVPEGCDEEESYENDGGVVHGCGGDGEVGRHAEERDGESGPC